jgi:hypothetical protein
MTMVPFSITGPVTGLMRAFVMLQVAPDPFSLTSMGWLSMLKRFPGVAAPPPAPWPPRPPNVAFSFATMSTRASSCERS